MRKQLFFDDNGLFGKGNVTRRYGKPKLVSNFNDGVSSTDYCSGSIFRLDDGRYRLIYFAHGKDFEGKKYVICLMKLLPENPIAERFLSNIYNL